MRQTRQYSRMNSIPFSLCLLLAFGLGSAGCDDGGEDGATYTVEGSVQKGPFVVGSSVQASPLDDAMNPTGTIFSTETLNDRGEFELTFTASGPVALEGSGYYYNEVTGNLSESTLTLRAFFVPEGAGVQQAYINMVTHLTIQRIEALMEEGAAFTDAVAQAEQELCDGLRLTVPDYEPSASGVELNVMGGDTDDNAYLLSVGAVMIQTAALREGSIEGNLQELLNTMARDLADGALEPALFDEVGAALLALDPRRVQRLLATRFDELGITDDVPDMGRVLDQDRDGIVNNDDLCPRDAAAAQTDSDGDGIGDDCDECPDTPCPDQACAPASSSEHLDEDFCYTPCEADSTCIDPTMTCVDHLAGFDFCTEGGGDGQPCLCDDLIMDEGANCTCHEGFECLSNELASCSDIITPGRGQCCFAAGSEGMACRIDLSCEEGLECLENEWGVCNEDFQECCLPSRGEGELCGQGRACNGDLACVENTMHICSDTLSERALCCVTSGTEGHPCRDDASCDDELACVENRSLVCEALSNDLNCCVATGGEGQLCGDDDSCDPELRCMRNEFGSVCEGFDETEWCCVATGGEGQPCGADDSCDPNLRCVSSEDYAYCEITNPIHAVDCCAPVGGPGELCQADGTCDSGLQCGRNYDYVPCDDLDSDVDCCYEVGGSGQLCRDDGSCDAGLICTSNEEEVCGIGFPREVSCCLP